MPGLTLRCVDSCTASLLRMSDDRNPNDVRVGDRVVLPDGVKGQMTSVTELGPTLQARVQTDDGDTLVIDVRSLRHDR